MLPLKQINKIYDIVTTTTETYSFVLVLPDYRHDEKNYIRIMIL